MRIVTKHFGAKGGSPASIIEVTIEGWSSTITEDVTDINGNVDVNFIDRLKDLVQELEDQNEKIQELKQS